jgi:hypothetical protein
MIFRRPWLEKKFLNEHNSPEYPAVEWIVAGEGDHGSEGDADGVEDLCRSVHPHL